MPRDNSNKRKSLILEIALKEAFGEIVAKPLSYRARASSTDRVGKAFKVEQGLRKCVVCERLFTREASQQHAEVACRPVMQGSSD